MNVATDHIVIDEHICFGKPRVAGTRITVRQIYELHEEEGRSADEIAESFPPLTKAGIYAALSYYFDHQEEMDLSAKQSQRFAEEYVKEHGLNSLEEKLRQVRESR